MIDKLVIISFTKAGATLGRRLADSLEGSLEASVYYKGSDASVDCAERLCCDTTDFVKSVFEKKTPLMFIGAMGIAIRMIAGSVKDKLTDSPVLVMDEKGQFVIPVLAGHVGGANELALMVSEVTGAVPVVTTATDINGAFSPDLFAKENRLTLINREGIAKVSKHALEGKAVTISVKDYPPSEKVDILIADDAHNIYRSGADKAELYLSPKQYVVGIGCRKGKEREAIESLLMRCIEELGISLKEVYSFASIDLKANEEGILEIARENRIPFITFEASMLKKVQGEFTPSSFVSEKTGVDNVCERSAVLAAGHGAKLVLAKTAENGVTIAIAKRFYGQEDF